MKDMIIHIAVDILLAISLLMSAVLALYFKNDEFVYAVNFDDVDTISDSYNHVVVVKKKDGSIWSIKQPSAALRRTNDDLVKENAYSNVNASLMKDGSFYIYGDNTYGQIGDGTTVNRDETQKYDVSDVIGAVRDYVINGSVSMAVTVDNSLYIWGCNTYGQIGDGQGENRKTPYKIMDDVKTIRLGSNHVAAIKNDGSLWMWGRNNKGQIGNESVQPIINEPTEIMDSGVSDVSLGNNHTAAVKEDGTLWMWGDNAYGQLGDGTRTGSNKPEKIKDDIQKIFLVNDYSTAIDETGNYWMWGRSLYNLFGEGVSSDLVDPLVVLKNVREASATGYICAVLKNDGTLSIWGNGFEPHNAGDTFGDINDIHDPDLDGGIIATELTGASGLLLDKNKSAVIRNDGTLWTWGRTQCNVLGFPYKTWQYREEESKYSNEVKNWLSRPYVVGIPEDVVSFDYGTDKAAAITNDGALWLWGEGTFGDHTLDAAPKKVLDNVKQVSLGDKHIAYTDKNDRLYMLGDNQYGQLGDGTTESDDIPKEIMDNVKLVSLGDNHSAAVTLDGDLYVWGDNSYGQIGNGTTDVCKEPYRIDGIEDKVIYISTGGTCTSAITEKGSLYMWGYYNYERHPSTPEMIVKDKYKCKEISVGTYHSAVLDEDGNLYMWGKNNYHRISEEDVDLIYKSPQWIMNNVEHVSLGTNHSGVIKKDGTVMLWGDDSFGELGDGIKGEGSAEASGHARIKVKLSYDGSYDNKNLCYVKIRGADRIKEYYDQGDECLIDQQVTASPYIICVGTDEEGYSVSAACTITDSNGNKTEKTITDDMPAAFIPKNDDDVTIELVYTITRDKGHLIIRTSFDDTLTDKEKGNVGFTVTGPEGFEEKLKKYSELTNGEWDLGEVITGSYTITETCSEKKRYKLEKTYLCDDEKKSEPSFIVNKDKSTAFTISHTYTFIPEIIKSDVKLSWTKHAYTGKTIKKPVPKVKINSVTLKKGTDYTVSYKEKTCKGIKEYTVTVKGRGKYKGKVVKHYKVFLDTVKYTLKSDKNGGKKCLVIKPRNSNLVKKYGCYYKVEIYSKKTSKKKKATIEKKHFDKKYKAVFVLQESSKFRFVHGKKYYIRIKICKKHKRSSKWSKVKSFKM